MNTSLLSDFQIYALSQNHKLNKEIRSSIQLEFVKRNFSDKEVEDLQKRYGNIVKVDDTNGLKTIYKLLLLAFPLIFVQYLNIIFVAIAANLLGKGKNKMYKDYWLYLMLGIVMWVVVFAIACLAFSDGIFK